MTTESYWSLAREGKGQITIKRSVFVGRAGPCQSPEEAERRIQAIRREEAGANHHCMAYIIGRGGEVQKYDDDGEPQGSAGPPILEVLRKQKLRDALIVVSRYFGGIKLGAAGLVRAYTEAAVLGLKEAKPVKMVAFIHLEFALGYDILGKYLDYLNQEGIREESRDFRDRAYSQVALPLQRQSEVLASVLALSHGQASYRELGQTYGPLPEAEHQSP